MPGTYKRDTEDRKQMKTTGSSSLRQSIAFLFLFVPLLLAYHAIATAEPAGQAGSPAEEALRLGEAMYRNGNLPSGKPMKGVVQGDLKVEGTMVTCANCHRRSGLGSFEGNVLTLPTNGAKLFAPLLSQQDLPGFGMRGQLDHPRPAYTDESLARALRFGVDPTERTLSETMPRYLLDDYDMEVLIAYLRNLSSVYSPGVTNKTVRFATVISDEMGAADRQAMLEPLLAYVREWNADVPVFEQTLRNNGNSETSPDVSKTKVNSRLRFQTVNRSRILLDVWELKGPFDTWREQLETLYRRQPVFAVLGGISSRIWRPVHQFCEDNRIPCIFPITDLPVISGDDWYTLYFSKGYYQEGETAAQYLARVIELPPERQLVQVFRDNDEGKALSRGFEDSWKKLEKGNLKNRLLTGGEPASGDLWKNLAASYPKAVMLVWLGPQDLAGIGSLAELSEKPSLLFVSSTMLKGRLISLPEEVRDFTLITYPTQLPDKENPSFAIVEQWLQLRKIQSKNMTVSSKLYFLTRMLGTVLSEMRGDFYRDYFLDLFDILPDQTFVATSYPRLSFGPGQRYASKGCYIVSFTGERQAQVIKLSDWVVY
jgi:hypothetical protein